MSDELYQLFFYVPETHLEQVKQAIFMAGAGRVGNYACCAWQVKGDGQFLPLAGSNPYLGELDKICNVAEYKVETVCPKSVLQQVIAAMIAAHPYETPAYGAIKLEMQ